MTSYQAVLSVRFFLEKKNLRVIIIMDVFASSSVSRLYIWRGLVGSHMFGPGQDKRKQQMNEVDELLKAESILRTRRGSRLPKLCQKTRTLRVRCRAPEVGTASLRPPLFTRSIPAPAPRPPSPSPSAAPPPVETDSKIEQTLEPSKSFVQPASETSLSLLRRPTGSRYSPCTLDSWQFRKVLRSYSLRQIGNVDWTKCMTFYEEHFPLLLETLYTDHARVIRDNLALMFRNRCRDVNLKLKKLDSRLDNIQRQYERNNEDFLTELRKQPFDPREWPWNLEEYCVAKDY
ncbi:uncharacterized protein LOC121372138 [Gigantopelta aegis]|uniref:uncharacterized protein LOC121372138 n=1 Tax=Gigantopelta aegis TaxID=1735272 RepID=UPI001B88B98E|nr:uncharacterized protein LOC121372138 [Gigantopelta aegis]